METNKNNMTLHLSGRRFGKLKAIEPTNKRVGTSIIWKCVCDCGKETFVSSNNLTTSGHPVISCGCAKIQDLTGKRFGKWTVLEMTSERRQGGVVWRCRCDCGTEKLVRSSGLATGNSTSCGCVGRQKLIDRISLGEGESAKNSMFRQYKHNAEVRNYSFSLSEYEFYSFTQMNCFYCGIEPKYEYGRETMNGYYICNGVDRLNNDRGYEIDNCVPCCWKCNKAKNDMSFVDFRNLVHLIYQNSNSAIEYT